ncbi:hypothetical protein VWM73_12700, partial [Campylobacter coli]
LDDIKSSAILIGDGHGLQGSLEVNGNFTADQSTLFTVGGNKSAMKVLKARLYEMQESERLAQESEARKSQVGSGDRSERIRT